MKRIANASPCPAHLVRAAELQKELGLNPATWMRYTRRGLIPGGNPGRGYYHAFTKREADRIRGKVALVRKLQADIGKMMSKMQ